MKITINVDINLYIFTEKAFNREKDLSDCHNDSFPVFLGSKPNEKKLVLAKEVLCRDGKFYYNRKEYDITEENIYNLHKEINGEGTFKVDSYYKKISVEELKKGNFYKKKISDLDKKFANFLEAISPVGYKNRLKEQLISNKDLLINYLSKL